MSVAIAGGLHADLGDRDRLPYRAADERAERVHRPRRAGRPGRAGGTWRRRRRCPGPCCPGRADAGGDEPGEQRARGRRLVGPGREQHVGGRPGAAVRLDPQPVRAPVPRTGCAAATIASVPAATHASMSRPTPAEIRERWISQSRRSSVTNRRRVGSSSASHRSRWIGRSESRPWRQPSGWARIRAAASASGSAHAARSVGREQRRGRSRPPRVLVGPRQLAVARHGDDPPGPAPADHGRGEVHRRVAGADDEHRLAGHHRRRAQRRRPRVARRTAGRRRRDVARGTTGSPGSSLPVAMTTASAARDPPPASATPRRRAGGAAASIAVTRDRPCSNAHRRPVARLGEQRPEVPPVRRPAGNPSGARPPSARSGPGPRAGRSS